MTDSRQREVDQLDAVDLGLGEGADPHLVFWRRQALARSKRIAELERELHRLRELLYEISEKAGEARS